MLIRQGDILLRRVGPSRMVKDRNEAPIVLAEGEHSGHLHRLHGKFGGATFFRDEAIARTFQNPHMYIGSVNVAGGGTLLHEFESGMPTGDHAPLDLPDGEYVAVNQRQYDPRGERLATD